MDTTTTPRHHFENELVIPQEMLEFVAEHLGNDEASLSAFSLVSRNFLSACRVHRFRHLTFASPSVEDRLHASERRRPQISSGIRVA